LPSTVEQLHRDLSGRGLSVLAINIQESPATVAAWAGEKKVTIPILLDVDGEVTKRYGVIATPTVFLVDRLGRLLGRAVGPHDWGSPAGTGLMTGLLTTPAGR
jgi:alkyl hydroperoxide reductase subunit AhpC